MSYIGDVSTGATIDKKFTTRAFSTGIPATLGGTPAVSVYKDNSTSQSTSGVTLTVDFDSVTGLNHLRITLASDGTFYAAGSNFDVVITTGTVGGVSVVGETVCSFSISNRVAGLGGVYSELTSVPSAATTLDEMIRWMFALSRNKITTSSTAQVLRNDADTAALGTAIVSDIGGVVTREEYT